MTDRNCIRNWIRPIWQGGMGVSVSTFGLAKEVAENGGIGTVSGALADQMFVRILQSGDKDGAIRRALSSFPYPEIVEPVLKKYYVPGGKVSNFALARPLELIPDTEMISLVLLANYCFVYLAKENHDGIIAINFLEKIQLPLLYGIAGAMLAKVDVIAVGAGIPKQIPDIIENFSKGKAACYNINIEGSNEKFPLVFDISSFLNDYVRLPKPAFVPIVSSEILAKRLLVDTGGRIDGFVVENYTAGGHNAPPRGKMSLTEIGEPIYSNRDNPNFEVFKEIGLPFYPAGGYGSPEKYNEAISFGAAGVQLGSIFALCFKSGMRSDNRNTAITRLKDDEIFSYTDPYASPTGFPFKVVSMEHTSADITLSYKRRNLCDLGALRTPYLKENGDIGYRCPAEPLAAFIRKGGTSEQTLGVTCLCNGLFNNTEVVGNGPAVLTLGNDLDFIKKILKRGDVYYSVGEVFDYVLNRK